MTLLCKSARNYTFKAYNLVYLYILEKNLIFKNRTIKICRKYKKKDFKSKTGEKGL